MRRSLRPRAGMGRACGLFHASVHGLCILLTSAGDPTAQPSNTYVLLCARVRKCRRVRPYSHVRPVCLVCLRPILIRRTTWGSSRTEQLKSILESLKCSSAARILALLIYASTCTVRRACSQIRSEVGAWNDVGKLLLTPRGHFVSLSLFR